MAVIGESILSTLYVAAQRMEEPVSATSSIAALSMIPLQPEALHELLVVYIARARHVNVSGGSDVNAKATHLESLACSDALQICLPPSNTHDSPTRVGTLDTDSTKKMAFISSAGSLLKPTDVTEEYRSLDALYVEYSVKGLGDHVSKAEETLIGQKPQRESDPLLALGEVCSWRSCLQRGTAVGSFRLCFWHDMLQAFLDSTESSQYLPMSLCGDHAKRWSIDQIIRKSSSLLEEVQSRQLGHSISGFFQHMQSTLANPLFVKQRTNREWTLDRDVSWYQANLTELEAKKGQWNEILVIEQAALHELKRLATLSVYPGVEMSLLESVLADLRDLAAGIRTEDLDLRHRLCLRKLALVRQRREDEEDRMLRQTSITQSTPALRSEHALYASGTVGALSDSSLAPVQQVIEILRKGRGRHRAGHSDSVRGSVPPSSTASGLPHARPRSRSAFSPQKEAALLAAYGKGRPPIKQPLARRIHAKK